METMVDLGVTGILEMPPAGTLTGIAKRALKGVETFALKTPDQLDDARAFCDKHGEASGASTPRRPGGWSSPPPRAPSTSPSEAAGADVLVARRARSARSPACATSTTVTAAARRPGRRVARRGRRPGLPRPAPAPPPPRGSVLMATISGSPPGAQHAAILGVGAYRPVPGRPQRRGRRGDRLQRRVDPAALRHQAAPLGRARRDHPDDVGRRVPRGARARRHRRPRRSTASIVATVSHLLQTPAVATAIAHELGTDQAAAFDISAACAGFCHGVALASDMVRAGSAGHVLVIGVERLSDITDLDRPRHRVHLRRRRRRRRGRPERHPGIGPVVWGSDGEQYDLIRQREDWRDVVGIRRARQRRDAAPVDAGQPGLPLGVVRDGQGRPAGPRPGRHHRRRPRRLRAPPGQHADHRRDGPRHEAARRGSGSPATSPSRATPRPPRSRSPSTG